MGQSLGKVRGQVWGYLAIGICLSLNGHLIAAPQKPNVSGSPAKASTRPDIVFVQTRNFVPGPLAKRFPQGSELVLLRATDAKRTPIHLSEEFFAAADPQVNFTATKVLFAGHKNQGERWQIWEMDLDGSHKRQITTCSEDCLRAVYLPEDELAFTVEESAPKNHHSYIAAAKLDGSKFRRVTFGPAQFRLETVLRDGRIVASAPWPLEQDTASRFLYTLRPDGTALESFRCEHGRRSVQSDAAESQDGTLVFIRNSNDIARTGGELVQIRRGAPLTTSLGTGPGTYDSPRALSAGELLVSKANTTTAGSQPRFDLYALSTKTGTLGERIFADPKLSSLQAVPVVPHDVPKRFWSTLTPESTTGYLISLNSYLTADVPSGKFNKTIAQVRVLTVNPEDGIERSLGEAPVESDGSFYVRVPANTPVRFVLLDSKGEIIHEEHSWVWTRPGEQRGCTGCHGDKNLAPENHWPMTLKRFDTPTPLGEAEHGLATATAK